MWAVKRETHYILELGIFVFWGVDICGICEFIESLDLVYRRKVMAHPSLRKTMVHFTGERHGLDLLYSFSFLK